MKKIFPYILVLVAGVLFGMTYSLTQKTSTTSESPTEKNSDSIESKEKSLERQIPADLALSEQATIKLFENSVNSVAFITTSNDSRSYFNRNPEEIPRGSGSGFVWDKEGHVVTNYHVIQGADNFTVTLNDQSMYEATLVGQEPNKDLAVLKIEAPKDKLSPIPVGQSSNLRVGQSVLAIGNPFGLDYTLTTGIISALGREITSVSQVKIRDVIQTDAAINPGNSGGPLLNSQGRLIGVNTAIYSPSGASAGIGFSIPVDVVSWVIPDLIQYGYVKKPVLGIELIPQQYRFNIEGAMIAHVVKNKGADKAGLRGVERDRSGRLIYGDVITGIDDYEIKDHSDLILALENFEVGEQVEVRFIREGKNMSETVTLSEN